MLLAPAEEHCCSWNSLSHVLSEGGQGFCELSHPPPAVGLWETILLVPLFTLGGLMRVFSYFFLWITTIIH